MFTDLCGHGGVVCGEFMNKISGNFNIYSKLSDLERGAVLSDNSEPTSTSPNSRKRKTLIPTSCTTLQLTRLARLHSLAVSTRVN